MGLDGDTVKFLDGKNFPDIKTALSSAREADTLARSRKVVDKPDPANVKGWGGFTELGWVADRQQYKVEPPKVGEGEVHDEKAFKTFNDAAHDARLAPWQAKAVYDAMHAHDNASLKALKQSGATANLELENQLRTEWGDKFDQNKELAKRAFSQFKPDAISAAQMDQIMGNASFVKLFNAIGAAMGEDKLVGGQNAGFGAKTPAAARAELMQLESDPAWFSIFNNPRHPQNAAYVKQRADLIGIMARTA